MRLFYLLLRMLRVKQIWYIFLALSVVVALSKLFLLRNRNNLTTNISNGTYMLKNVHLIKSNMFNHPPLFVAPVKPSTKFIPGQFLVGVMPKSSSYCNFKYGSDTFNWTRNVSFTPELGASGPYRVIYNIVENSYKSNNVSLFGLTYCTHATPEFLYHIVEIVRRWDSYVSIAVFVPGNDAFLSLIIIRQICRCFPEMSKISLHFIFPAQHPPEFHENSNDGTTSLNNTLFKDCSAPKAILSKEFETYKSKKDLFYPINVARNVARMGARTTFVLVSDVELLPSQNLVSEFFSMLGRFQKRQNIFHPLISEETSLKKYVFVLPVFEVDSEETDVPQTKSDLLSLYGKSKAVYFHRWVCLHCQRFPGLQRWLQKTPPGAPNIRPLLVVRREFPYNRWEPIYIGTNQEPMYSELLSWEGQQDKMTQMNEMCLLGYRFVILDGAFLVHTPGMKRKSDLSTNQTMWQKPHQRRNIKIYESITQEMIQKYKGNKRCRVSDEVKLIRWQNLNKIFQLADFNHENNILYFGMKVYLT